MSHSNRSSAPVLIVLSSILTVSSILNQAHAAPVALPTVTPGPFHPYNLMIGSQTYGIRYAFSDENGVNLENITADSNSNSIIVKIDDENPNHVADSSMSDWEKRVFYIELPRDVINSNSTKYLGPPCTGTDGDPINASSFDTDYNISVTSLASNGRTNPFSGHFSGGGTCNNASRTSEISYPAGKSTIVIQGTTMVPEFGSPIATTIMTIGIFGAIGITTAHALRSNIRSRSKA